MVVNNTPINVNNVLIEHVEWYVYLGQRYNLKKKNQDKELQRIILAGWAAYTLISSKATLPSAWRDMCTTHVCCQIWHMVQRPGNWPSEHRTNLRPNFPKGKEVCSTSLTTYKDRNTNIWVTERTKVIDVISNVSKMIWSWAGHINRLKDDRWTSRVTTWRQYDKKIRQGRPAKRWRDDLDKYWSDTIWQKIAQYRLTWRPHAEAFAQPRDTTAA